MTDYIKVLSDPTKQALADINRRADRATMYGLRAVGRKVRQEAQRRAPVYKGARSAATAREMKALAKAGMTGGVGDAVISGLLKTSISSSKRFQKQGAFYRLGIAPRGPRVRLYSAKAEAARPYMRPGWDAAVEQMEAVFAKAWANATKPK